eukprot:6796115-Heterocapsa_arctica.AAC.1
MAARLRLKVVTVSRQMQPIVHAARTCALAAPQHSPSTTRLALRCRAATAATPVRALLRDLALDLTQFHCSR